MVGVRPVGPDRCRGPCRPVPGPCSNQVPRESPSELAADDVRPTVRVIHPTATEHALTVRLTGNVTIETNISVASEVGGRVIWVSPNFRPGGVLAAGQTVVRLDSEELQLQMKSARLAKTEITVPFASRVTATDVGIGELVVPVVPLGTVYRVGALQVNAPIDPRHLQYLAPIIRRTARVVTQSGTYAAEVERVSAQIDSQSRLATVYVERRRALSGFLPEGGAGGHRPPPRVAAGIRLVRGIGHHGGGRRRPALRADRM